MIYPTNLTYYDQPYATTLKTEIVHCIKQSDGKITVFLDSTIFYPAGGGQPSDQGLITTDTGKIEIRNVQMQEGAVKHEGLMIEGDVSEGQEAMLELNWERRHWNMRVHSAGHVIHDVLMGIKGGLTPIRGDHGSKPYLEYSPEIEPEIQDRLEKEVNRVILENRTVTTKETNLDELSKIARFIPPNLPKNKPLRVLQIEGFYAMPDGGTQVKQLGEIGEVKILSISNNQNKATIKYQVVK